MLKTHLDLEEKQKKFPKVIHQTYISEETIPEHWKISLLEWKRLHSSSEVPIEERGEYRFWSDEDNLLFIEENFPDFLQTYKNFKYPIQRADAVRYCILYKFGGIYSDLDMVPKENVFNHFNNGSVFLIKSANAENHYTNCFMASLPKQKFWLECIEEMKKPLPKYIVGKHFTILSSTGPLMLDRVAKKTLQQITIIPSKVFSPLDALKIENGEKEDDIAIIRNIKGGSWHSFDTKFYDFFYKTRKVFLGMAIAFAIVLIFFAIKLMFSYFWMRNNCEIVCRIKK